MTVFARLSLPDLAARFNSDDSCRAYLEELRWPKGPACPKCKGKNISPVSGREGVLRCQNCQAQFTVTARTVFNDSHLPLAKWFMATYILCESKKGVSALQLMRILGIGGYKTAWYLCHRIRSAMLESQKQPLDGVVEIDETYIGGKPRINRPRRREKDVVIAIRQRNGQLRMFKAKAAKAEVISQIIKENVSENVDVLITDESMIYPFALSGPRKKAHKTIQHNRVYVDGSIHTNTVESAFSLLKRGIIGSWHNVSAKHLPAYLDEVSFRFNRRERTDLFEDTLRHMITAPVLTFQKLTKKNAA